MNIWRLVLEICLSLVSTTMLSTSSFGRRSNLQESSILCVSWWYYFNDKCNRASDVTWHYDFWGLTSWNNFYDVFTSWSPTGRGTPRWSMNKYSRSRGRLRWHLCSSLFRNFLELSVVYQCVRPNTKPDNEHVKIMRARLCGERDIDYVTARLLQRKHTHFMTSDTGLTQEYHDYFSIWFEIFAETLNGWRTIHSETQDKSGRMYKERGNWTSDHCHCYCKDFWKIRERERERERKRERERESVRASARSNKRIHHANLAAHQAPQNTTPPHTTQHTTQKHITHTSHWVLILVNRNEKR